MSAPALSKKDRWQDTINAVIQSVVIVVGMSPVAFEMRRPGTTMGTGFVVHVGPEICLILTAGHVVGEGPFEGFCRFANKEEVKVSVLWRDPIHDGALLSLLVNDIKAAKLVALPLRPHLAKVGMDIRIVGNDEGHETAVLPGVLNRVDANAPYYGRNHYNDFNTNYFQGSNDASGGSSGSPVVDIQGFVIAMFVGGSNEGATNMFLPLERLCRALDCLLKEQPVTRGNIGCQFWIEPIPQCERLGLTDKLRRVVQEDCPGAMNMLVAKQVLPGERSKGKIEEGDILVKVDDITIIDLNSLEDILDSRVGNAIKLLLLRSGFEVEVQVEVGDLYKNTPDRYVVYGGASFQPVSYQLARHHYIPCQGVVVCGDGEGYGTWAQRHWLIRKVDNQPVPDLDSFVDVIKAIPENSSVQFTYEDLACKPRQSSTMHIRIHRFWQREILLVTNDRETGLWHKQVLCDRPADPDCPPFITASFPQLNINDPAFPGVSNYARSFVRVVCDTQLPFDGEGSMHRTGDGLVVDAPLGLVVVSRHIIPHDFSRVYVVIAGSIPVDANVILSHPEHNFVLIRYDPDLFKADVFSAKLSEAEICRGDEVYFLGPDGSDINCILHEKTNVTNISPLDLHHDTAWTPTYCAINFNSIQVGTKLGASCDTGVLVNQRGEVVALWLEYRGQGVEGGKEDCWNRGFSVKTVRPVISQIQAVLSPSLRIFGAQFWPTTKHDARNSGVSQRWIDTLESTPSASHQFLQVNRMTSACESEGLDGFQVGDTLLTINGRLVTNYSDLDMHWKGQEAPVAEVVRDGAELSITLPTFTAESFETDHVVYALGATVQKPLLAVRRRASSTPSNVFISSIADGSPADLYGMSNIFVTHINDKPTWDLDSFVNVLSGIVTDADFCLTVVGYDGDQTVLTMRNNTSYHPLQQWKKDKSDGHWRRVECGAD